MGKNRVITISRQLGSGGREIGQILAQELGIAFYDKELISLAAEKNGIDKEFFENADEQPVNRFAYSFWGMPNYMGSFNGYTDLLTNDKLFGLQANIIKEIAAEKPCLIVGRCADYILEDDADCVSIFIYADLPKRIERVMERHELNKEQAQKFISKTDKRRANYYNFFTNKDWSSVNSYDLCIDSGIIGIENTIKLIRNYLDYRPHKE